MSNIPGGVHKFSGMGQSNDRSTTGSGSGGRPKVKLPGGKGKEAGGKDNLGTTSQSVRDMSYPKRGGGSARPAGVSVHDGKSGGGVKQPKSGTGLMSHEG